jgi:ABC-2 type transport system permease protein
LAVVNYHAMAAMHLRVSHLTAILGGMAELVGFVFLWSAVYLSSPALAGYSFQQMVTYYVVAMVLSEGARYETNWELWSDIRDGKLAAVAIRPISTCSYYVARQIGQVILPTSIRVAVAIFLGLSTRQHIFVPYLPTQWMAFAVSVAFAVYLASLLSVARGLAAFWLLDYGPFGWLDHLLVRFFAGGFLPLGLFPPLLRAIANWLPFRFIVYDPIQIYLGHTTVAQALTVVAGQALWVIGTFALVVVLWRRGSRRYTGEGL